MKNLLLILALFVGNSFAKDDYPIELTCEIGESIIYVNIEEVPERTWLQPISFTSFGPVTNIWQSFKNKKKYASKRKNRFKIDSEIIFFSIPAGGLGNLIFIEINRLSGKLKTGLSQGQCFKGFKKYKEKKF